MFGRFESEIAPKREDNGSGEKNDLATLLDIFSIRIRPRIVAFLGGLFCFTTYLVVVGWLAPTDHSLPNASRPAAVVTLLLFCSVAAALLLRYVMHGKILFRGDRFVWLGYAIVFAWSGSQSAIGKFLPICTFNGFLITPIEPNIAAFLIAALFAFSAAVMICLNVPRRHHSQGSYHLAVQPGWMSRYFRLNSWLGTFGLFSYVVISLEHAYARRFFTEMTASSFLRRPPEFMIEIVAFFFCNCAAYLLNQICDRDIDKYLKGKNPFDSSEQGRSRLFFAKFLFLSLVLLTAVLGFIISTKFVFFLLAYLGLLSLYSVPPIRVKGIPFVDLLTVTVAISCLPFLMAEAASSHAYPGLFWLGGGVSLFVAASHLLQSTRDADADRSAGLRTSAIMLGKTKSIQICVLFTVLGTAIVSYFFWQYTTVTWLDAKLDTFILILSLLLYLPPLTPQVLQLKNASTDLKEFERLMRSSSYAICITLIIYSLLIA